MIRRGLCWALLVVGVAALGGAAVQHHTLALGVVGVIVVAVLLARPTWAAVGAVTLLPIQLDVLPGLPVNVAASDLLTVVALVGWAVTDLLRTGDDRRTDGADLSPRAVRPVALGLLVYSGATVLTVVVHPSSTGVVTAAQRAEIVVGALLVGGGLVRNGKLGPALEGFLLTATATAAAAIVQRGGENILGAQKNPAAGFIAAALILVVVLRPGRRWWVYAPVLAVGLLAAQSRGALIGIVAAAVVTVLVVRRGERVKLAVLFAVVAGLFVAAFDRLPSAAQSRLLNYTGSGEYAASTREGFQADAFDAFRSSPWWGEGVGNYYGGVRFPGVVDPHQVLYLQLAEGGVVLLVAFVVLVLVSLVVCFRALGGSRLAVVALAVQVSTIGHAMFDVYWVRGTPVLAFLLVGATTAVLRYADAGDGRSDHWLRSSTDGPEPGTAPAVLAPAGAPRAG